MAQTKVYLNPFMGRTDGVVFCGQNFGNFDDKNITESYEKEVVKKIGDGEDDFIIEKVVAVYKTYNRDKFIQDQSDDVGILNILKKVALSGDDLTQENPFAAKPGYFDMTQVPEDLAGVQDLVSKAKEVWDTLPEDLKGNLDYETFVKTMSTQKVYDALLKKAQDEKSAAAAQAQAEKGDE